MSHIDVPPVWTFGLLILAGLLSLVAPWPDSGPWLRLIGTVVMALGLTLIAMAARALFAARTPLLPRREPAALVTRGVFKVSRNPIYLGLVLFLAGFCLIAGSLLSLITVPALVWVLNRRFIDGEEDRLRAAFGPAFDAWAAGTRRWL